MPEQWLAEHCGGRSFLTPSCTASLELSCRLVLSPGDEVIVPSFSFPSCSNAVILAGGVPVYVDIDPQTLSLSDFSKSITPRTKAVMPLHYAGVSCDEVLELARPHGLWVIEDAAQCIGNWKLSGDLGCISFHSTKNVECGEGGALVVSPRLVEEAELMIDCGTTKAKYRRGESDGYDWLGVGTSCLLSPYLRERLMEQFLRVQEITDRRVRAWRVYNKLINAFKASKEGNGHIFWFLTRKQREVIEKLRKVGVKAEIGRAHV